LEAISGNVSYFYSTNQTNFNKILGSPIAYWANEKILNSFDNELLGEPSILLKFV
jgi:hypothetical protein